MDAVTITIRSDLFKRLQDLAVPLVDTIDSVIEKLCENWERNPPESAGKFTRLYNETFENWGPDGAATAVVDRVLAEEAASLAPKEGRLTGRQLALVRKYLDPYYRAGTITVSRSTELPVGLPFTSDYQGSVLTAVVNNAGIEFDGKTYDSPSAAAVAAKMSLGLDEKAAQTNGWSFWSFGRGTPQGTFTINVFRQYRRMQLDALFPTRRQVEG